MAQIGEKTLAYIDREGVYSIEGLELKPILENFEGSCRVGKTLRTNNTNAIFLNIKDKRVRGLLINPETFSVEKEAILQVSGEREYMIDHQVIIPEENVLVSVTQGGRISVNRFNFEEGSTTNLGGFKLELKKEITEEVQSVSIFGEFVLVQVAYTGESPYGLISRIVLFKFTKDEGVKFLSEIDMRETKLEICEKLTFLKNLKNGNLVYFAGVSGIEQSQLVVFELNSSSFEIKELSSERSKLDMYEAFSLIHLDGEHATLATIGKNSVLFLIDFNLN